MIKIQFILLIVTTAFSCSHKVYKNKTTPFAGYQFNLFSDSLGKNGSIFAMHKQSKKLLHFASLDIPRTTYQVFLNNGPEVIQTRLGVFINFLSNASVSYPDSIRFQDYIIEVKLKFKDAFLDRSHLQDALTIIQSSKKRLLDDLKIAEPGDFYFFLITETIRVQQLQYSFDRASAEKLKSSPFFNEFIHSNLGISTVAENPLTFTLKSPSYVNVLIKLLPLPDFEKKREMDVAAISSAKQIIVPVVSQ